jgi:acetyl-CoA carboxylase carboxyl transferase subunit alpha
MASNRRYLEFERAIGKLEEQIAELEERQRAKGTDCSAEIRELRENLVRVQKKTFSALSAWEMVQLARHPDRPHADDYIEATVKDFVELHGDRRFGDDRAIVTGLGRIGGERVLVVAHRKGKDTKERMACHFGCAHPEGYRKALRTMRTAEKFGLPVVALIDTPGAYPGVGAEERGIAEAIAFNLQQMSRLRVPVVAAVIGEGGSGGALGIGLGDRVVVMEYAYYSVISPEGCAAILWKSGEQADLAAEALKLTSRHLKELGVVDEVVPEPLGGAHRDPRQAAASLERSIVRNLWELKQLDTDTLLEQRYAKYRRLGRVAPGAVAAAVAVS